ncbi:MAG: M56 family metallopeptidase [bacterium]|nr:M56 family metallopeptidase [bacterium]
MTDRIVIAAGWTLVHFLWQGILIAGLLELVLAMLRRHSASTRYVVRCGALLAMVLAPIVTFFVVAQGEIPRPLHPAVLVFARPLEPRASGVEGLLPWVVLGWSMGATVLAVRLGLGMRRIRNLRVRTRGCSLDGSARRSFDRVAARLGVRAAAVVVDSARLAAPIAVGWLRPLVFFPAHVLTGLTPAQIECLIAHELAHVARRDYLVNVLQSIVETVLFYHPAVWWVSAGIRTEREFCCDDVALDVTRDGVAYARALVSLEASRGKEELGIGVSTLGGSLMQRIQRLVGASDLPRRSRGYVTVYLLLPLLGAGAIGAAALGTGPTQDAREQVAPVRAAQDWVAVSQDPRSSARDLAREVAALREQVRELSNQLNALRGGEDVEEPEEAGAYSLYRKRDNQKQQNEAKEERNRWYQNKNPFDGDSFYQRAPNKESLNQWRPYFDDTQNGYRFFGPGEAPKDSQKNRREGSERTKTWRWKVEGPSQGQTQEFRFDFTYPETQQWNYRFPGNFKAPEDFEFPKNFQGSWLPAEPDDSSANPWQSRYSVWSGKGAGPRDAPEPDASWPKVNKEIYREWLEAVRESEPEIEEILEEVFEEVGPFGEPIEYELEPERIYEEIVEDLVEEVFEVEPSPEEALEEIFEVREVREVREVSEPVRRPRRTERFQ